MVSSFLRIALFLGLCASSAAAQTLERGPYLQQGGPDSILVCWRTNVTADSEVRFGSAPGSLVNTVQSGAAVLEHRVLLTGLNPDTDYYYSVGTSTQVLAGDDADHVFRTAPAPGAALDTRIWIVGDSGEANANAMAVRDAYQAYPGSDDTQLFLMLGDNAYDDGTDAEYTAAVFDIYPEMLRRAPVWSTFGNHDNFTASGAAYFTAFEFPTAAELGGVPSGTESYYSFDYGDAHFVCLDSEEGSSSAAMVSWLTSDLAASDARWLITFWHHPPYTKGSHDSDEESKLIEMRSTFLPILEDYGVDLVLCGHSHSYERSYLIDSHYGFSSEFGPALQLDAGDGQAMGDGSYEKSAGPHNGTVYIVAGSSSKVSSGDLDHPAMIVSLGQLGSVVLDIQGSRLDATFLRANGATPDHFTIEKGPDSVAPKLVSAKALGGVQLELRFSEELDLASSTTVANYSLDGGMSVLGAQLQPDGRTVLLDTTVLVPLTNYTLTANAIADLSGNQSSNDQVTFPYEPLTEISFRDGVFPTAAYDGTTDATIEQADPTANFATETLLLIDGDDGGDSDLSSLVRWDISAIPPGSTVQSAELKLRVTDDSGDTYEAYAVLQPWVEGELTWNQASVGSPWQSPGLNGVLDKGVEVIGTLVASTTGVATVTLNVDGVALVQSWVDDPSTNHGLVFTDTDASNGVDMRSSDAGNATLRPRINITFLETGPPDLGFSYCPALPNSTGSEAQLVASGSVLVADNDLVLSASELPVDQFGYFLASQTQGFVHFPAGSSGDLCLGGNIARFRDQLQSSGAMGEFSISVDLQAIPTFPLSAVQPGETWNFQTWFRDSDPTPTSNFTQGLSITFL